MNPLPAIRRLWARVVRRLARRELDAERRRSEFLMRELARTERAGRQAELDRAILRHVVGGLRQGQGSRGRGPGDAA